MAGTISYQSSATGSKGVSGVVFTIPLSSVNGDFVIVGISYPSSSISVLSVQDSNGNPYKRISSASNVSITTELWSTANSSPTSTGGLITITLSAPGIDSAGVAASYRTVGPQQGLRSNNTSSGTILQTTLPVPLVSGGWFIGIFGGNASAAFLPNFGFLRNQVSSVSSSVCIVDTGGVNGSLIIGVSVGTTMVWSNPVTELDPALDAPTINRFRPSYGCGRPAVFSNTI